MSDRILIPWITGSLHAQYDGQKSSKNKFEILCIIIYGISKTIGLEAIISVSAPNLTDEQVARIQQNNRNLQSNPFGAKRFSSSSDDPFRGLFEIFTATLPNRLVGGIL